MKDAYRNIAGIYDRLFENMNKGLRLAGVRMFRPSKVMNILDVGCGTGTHLELYQRYECNLYGIDLSPSMLEMARARLGGTARLELGDAANMPYENRKFDLIISMLSLHEMSQQTRSGVIAEIKRVLKDDGHIMLIDFHSGPYRPLQGWISKVIIRHYHGLNFERRVPIFSAILNLFVRDRHHFRVHCCSKREKISPRKQTVIMFIVSGP